MLWAILINFAVAAFLYPEVFLRFDLRLVQGHETCGPMQYVFFLIGQFFQGGIQLYNPYDHLNGSFTQLSVGLYTPFNFLIALGYIVLSPFVDEPAKFFHHWYVFAYYGLGLLLRTYGTYLLAHYITKSRWIAIATTVLVNSFCALTLIHMGGMCVSLVYSFLPLLLFCLVYYWETRKFQAILGTVLIFVVAAVHMLYVGLGYFYQVLHLFVLDMFFIWIIFQRGKKPLLSDQIHWKSVGKLALVMALIFLPVIWWGTNLIQDYQVVDSGLGTSSGRFNRIFKPAAMLNDPLRYFISSDKVFHSAYDFTTSGWYLGGAFLGISIMVLAMIGIVLGKHVYKIVFISAAVIMGFLNVPSNQGGWMTWAHWVDALTNPFCFLVRSFHYTVLLWYITFAIPICLGIQALIAIVKKDFERIYAGRINILKGVLAVLIGLSFMIPDARIKAYAISVLGLFLVFFILFDQQKFKIPRMWLAAIVFASITCIEFGVLRTYINTQSVDMNWAYWDGLRVKPRVHSAMYTPPIPMVMDYQNPKILPVRFFYRTDDQVVFPLICEFQGMFGLFYRYMPLVLRLERPGHMYVPRLKVYTDIDKNKPMQEYLRRDGRIMYTADAAIAPDAAAFERIVNQGLDRRVIQAEGAHADKIKKISDVQLPPALPMNFKRNIYAFDAQNAKVQKKKEGLQYQWALPKGFPHYLTTTVFTPDVQLWQLTVGNRALVLMQGALVTPLTFDVNNVREGYLTVLMPPQETIKEPVNLAVLTPAGLVDIWRNTQDEFGFTYNFERDGWWVMHQPYDSKWQLYIDGVKTPIAKINGYFIGAPVTAGEHQIYLTYWPNSPLRPLIIISVLAALAGLFVALRWSWRWGKE